ncbi:MAG: hypothetical protein U0573_05685 [Phycisphaerales bacterium]|nr:hypothetical protein [Planctomycetota bacterium]
MRQRHLPYRGVLWMLWLFFAMCGATRLLAATLFYYPAFHLMELLKALTAVTSIITMFIVFKNAPLVLSLPSLIPSYKKSQDELETLRRQSLSHAEARRVLEDRASLLTVRDRRVRRALVGTRLATASWDAQSGAIFWENGLRELFGEPQQLERPVRDWNEVLDDRARSVLLESTRAALLDHASLDLTLSVPGSDRTTLDIRIRAVRDDAIPQSQSAVVGSVAVVSGDLAHTRRG